MSKVISNQTIDDFIKYYLEIEDFGHLVATDDERLNAEAVLNIKDKFKTFIESDH